MRKQAASDAAALPDQDELEMLVQRLTQVAGGKQDRNSSQGAGQEVTPDKGYVEWSPVLHSTDLQRAFSLWAACTTGLWSRPLIKKVGRCS